MTNPAPPFPHAQRRAHLAEQLHAQGGGVMVLGGAQELIRNNDAHYPFRQHSSFLYLTGFEEPQAVLVLFAADNNAVRSVLFCRAKDEEREVWDGFRLGPQAAPEVLGVSEAYPIDALTEQLPTLLSGQSTVWVDPSSGGAALKALIDNACERIRNKERGGPVAPTQWRDACRLIDEMRLLKDAQELDAMRHSAQIAAAAHVRAMKYSAAQHQRTDNPLREYELEAELLHEFRSRGTTGVAYNSIVAAGANACVLHYAAGNAVLKAGDLCLIDAGCEYLGYASDITRTFPVNGKFSDAQRTLYDIVLAAQEAAIAAIRPGARKSDYHWAAVRVLAQGMLDVGLLPKDKHGSVDDVIDTAAYRRFYMHGTGHWLGLDVHDVGDNLQRDEAPVDQPNGLGGRMSAHPSRILQSGMVVTVEPGIYVRPAPDIDEKFWNIGIRIEDDAVVTPSGCELISRGVPVKADEIEALMK